MAEILKMFDLNGIVGLKLASSIVVVAVAFFLGLKRLMARNANKLQQKQHQQQRSGGANKKQKTTTTTHAQKKKSTVAPASAAAAPLAQKLTPRQQQQKEAAEMKKSKAKKMEEDVKKVQQTATVGKKVVKVTKVAASAKKQQPKMKRNTSALADAAGADVTALEGGVGAGEWQTVRPKKHQKKGPNDPLIQAVAEIAANVKKTSHNNNNSPKKEHKKPQPVTIEAAAIEATIGESDWEATSQQPKTKKRALRE